MIASSALETAPMLSPPIAAVMKSAMYVSVVVTIAIKAVIMRIINTLLTWPNAGWQLCSFSGF